MLAPRRKGALLAALLTVISLVVVPSAPAGATARPQSGFVHPGVLVSRSQLDFVRLMVNLHQQPWQGAYDQMMANPLAAPDRQPHPWAVVECGSRSMPNLGCTDERQDALAAYANALAWYITRNKAYAEKAITIMDAWSSTVTSHINSNGPLQTGWAGSTWPRVAEIIRYTYNGWPKASIDRFATMLRTVYLPVVIKGHAINNGNWELTMMEAAVGISVFLDDRASYDIAIAKFKQRVPEYLYLTSDGPLPPAPVGGNVTTTEKLYAFWGNQTTFVDGLAQETCRDFVHSGYGIANIAHVAETTRIQHQDLWPELKVRMSKALEFHAQYELGAPVPSWLCGGKLTLGLGPATEAAYNALHNRMWVSLPYTKRLTEQHRPADTNTLFIGWDTLTSAYNLF
jgi:hypothetical protein